MTAQQLKNSILQMAMQGKLVPQDSNDEPASVLIQKIREEKDQMIKDGKIKEEKNPSYIFRGEDGLFYEQIENKEPVCIEDEIPFEIPKSWEFVRLRTVCQLTDGEKKSNQKYPIMDAKFLRGSEDVKYSENGKYVAKNTKIILVDGENSGEVFTVPQDGYMGSTFKELWISSELCEAYVLYFIDSYRDLLKNSKKGVAIPHLKKELFYGLYLPIPPLSEQQRIANTLSEVQNYITRYGYYEDTLDLLNDNFPNEMKKSILQQAVQGKLVSQDPNDEPASVLINRIHDEKEQFIKDGKIKRDKHESVIYRKDGSYYERVDGDERCIDGEIPFEIPDNWEWARLKTLAFKITDGTHHSPPNSSHGEYMYITAKNIKEQGIDLSDVTYVSKDIQDEIYSRCNPEKGDVLLIKDGATTGITTVNNIAEPYSLLSSVALLKFPQDILPWYIVYVLRSDLFYKKIRTEMKGTGITRITLKQIEPLLVPVPPFDEQDRIVNKVAQALQVIDSVKG